MISYISSRFLAKTSRAVFFFYKGGGTGFIGEMSSGNFGTDSLCFKEFPRDGISDLNF
jgi:hypothetical protein